MPKVTHESRLILIPSFIEEMKNPDITFYVIAEKYGVSYTTVHNFAHKHNLVCGRIPGGTKRIVKPAIIDQIKELTLLGKDINEICKATNLSKGTVNRYRKLHGLTKAYDRSTPRKRDYNNADEKSVPCSRIALIRVTNLAAKQGKDLKDIVDAAINFYLDSPNQ